MSGFTKGPWSIRTTGQHWNNPDLTNIEINHGADQECVCDTVYKIEDANLISAAPDMYDALLVAMRSIDPEDINSLELCNTALAKADGKGE